MIRIRRLFPIVLLSLGLSCVAVAADEPAVEPPGPDETLIYIVRKSRMLGAAVGHWIAINDETIARLRSDKHAVIRYPAGIITLNMANSGVPVAAIALDNRGGETVYLEFKINEWGFTVHDAKSAEKLIRKTERMKDIDEIVPNPEKYQVLMNLSRMGFDVMQPAQAPAEPDAEHAVITVLRQKDGDKFDFGIWHEQGFVGTLGAEEALSFRVPPGRHFLMAANNGFTQLTIDAEAGKHYYAWLDYGAMMGRVRLTPIPLTDARQLDRMLEKVSWVEPGPGADAEGIRVREEMVTEYIRGVSTMAETGEVDANLMRAEHAFD